MNLAGDLWVYDLGGRPPIKLTFDSGAFTALWSPDGRRIIYENSNGALESIPADGSTASRNPHRPGDISIRSAGWVAAPR